MKNRLAAMLFFLILPVSAPASGPCSGKEACEGNRKPSLEELLKAPEKPGENQPAAAMKNEGLKETSPSVTDTAAPEKDLHKWTTPKAGFEKPGFLLLWAAILIFLYYYLREKKKKNKKKGG